MITLKEENAEQNIFRLVDKLTRFNVLLALAMGVVLGFGISRPNSNLVWAISLLLILLAWYFETVVNRKIKSRIREVIDHIAVKP
ncbi:MAG: hypothetical protein JOZ62_08090 [Acidobacteriaceae bacterium]|nr:hypothetical protein [Acidobacteriaceae bacterium]